MIRKSGQGIFDSGVKMGGKYISTDRIVPSLRCVPISNSKFPKTLEADWIAPNSTIIGDVELGEGSSLWHGVIVRGDLSKVKIGKNTLVQDNTVISSSDSKEIKIGDNVFIGPNCSIDSC